MQLSQKHNTFSQFFAAFLKFTLNFKYFGKKSNFRRFCISKIMDCEKVVRSMSKKSSFRGSFDKQHGKRAQALLKSQSKHLDQSGTLSGKLSWRRSPLLTWKILGLLVNTLAADEKYHVLKWDNLTIPIQMQLSQKQNFFSSIFCCIFEIWIKLWTFWKKRWASQL